ncbi:MAG: hypothetical protein ACFFC3_07535 [Candidatus Odinarchaeota archaeon]
MRKPIENIILFIGIVFLTLGISTFFIILVRGGLSNILDNWYWVITGSILLSIGSSLLYLRNKMIELKPESKID